MKKIISVILSAVFIFSAVPSMEAEAADINKRAGKVYADLLKDYLDANEIMKGDSPVYDWENSRVNGEFALSCQNDTSIPAYRIIDYNDDGVPELFIGLYPSNFGSVWIYDAYTFYKGKAVRLVGDIGNHAGTCVLCKNGILKNVASGSVFRSDTKFQKLPPNKGKLSTALRLTDSTDYDSHITTYTKKEHGKKAKISREQFVRLYKKYDKPVKVTFYKADSKSISNIKKGDFTYPGQKKWRGKTGEKTHYE